MSSLLTSTPTGGRRRTTDSTAGSTTTTSRLYGTDDQALDQIAREAEARLAARRKARAEARALRQKELEKQANENDECMDRHYEGNSPAGEYTTKYRSRENRHGSFVSNASSSYSGSRRSSIDSTSITDGHHYNNESTPNNTNYRFQLQELEENFRRAMLSNAQMDSEKTALQYQVDNYRDDMEELEENTLRVQREHRDKCRAFDQLTRDYAKLQQDVAYLQYSLKQRDELIEEHGLELVGADGEVVPLVNGDAAGGKENGDHGGGKGGLVVAATQKRRLSAAALITPEAALVLNSVGEGSLDVRLKRLAEERSSMREEIESLRRELDEERCKVARLESGANHTTNGPDANHAVDIQREANKLLGDYKYRLKKTEQENATLQSSVTRLEAQVARYKTAAEEGEKNEEELKTEKRRILRELREAQARVEELETSNAHLQKRIDKLKSSRTATLLSQNAPSPTPP